MGSRRRRTCTCTCIGQLTEYRLKYLSQRVSTVFPEAKHLSCLLLQRKKRLLFELNTIKVVNKPESVCFSRSHGENRMTLVVCDSSSRSAAPAGARRPLIDEQRKGISQNVNLTNYRKTQTMTKALSLSNSVPTVNTGTASRRTDVITQEEPPRKKMLQI